jgi:hypothetical protein
MKNFQLRISNILTFLDISLKHVHFYHEIGFYIKDRIPL